MALTILHQRLLSGISRFVLLFAVGTSCSGSQFSGLGHASSAGKESGETGDQTQAPPAPDENADAPIWINGASLTCNWNSMNSEDQLSLDCGLGRLNQQIEAPKDLKIFTNWVITKEGGQTVSFHKILDDKAPLRILVTLIAKSIPGSTITVYVVVDHKTLVYSAKFDDVLPGLKDDPGFGRCLLSDRIIAECFAEAEISLPRGNPIVDGEPTTDPMDPLIFMTCPPNFIHVSPGDTLDDFCVAKYEMKEPTKGVIESTPNGRPKLVTALTDAISKCNSMGTGFGLISNDQWMAIAREIEWQPENWSGGEVNDGQLNRGHSDGSPALVLPASADDREGCYQTEQACGFLGIDSDQKRTFLLGNGEILWDFSGNGAEIIDWPVSVDKAKPAGDAFWEWTELNAAIDTATMPPAAFKSSSPKLRSVNGIGGYWAGKTKADPGSGISTLGEPFPRLNAPGNVQRGGSLVDLTMAGIYALAVDVDPAGQTGSSAFRCVWTPPPGSAIGGYPREALPPEVP